jgi:uncharacterized repeat protein (TIGR04138 family)
MSSSEIYGTIEELAESCGRFRTEGFLFVFRALEHCRNRLKRSGHVSGQELVESARQLAIEEYGPMAKSVLNHWGIERTEDFGEIVFLLVENDLLGKTDEDKIDDFRDGFDFETEFVRNYRW